MKHFFILLYRSTIIGMTDEEFQKLNQEKNIGPNLDKLIEKYDIDVWCIGFLLGIFIFIFILIYWTFL